MKTPEIMLFDINGIGYASMYQPNLRQLAHNGHPTAALHGALTSLFSRMTEYPEALPVVLWDGHAGWRKELFPGYKSNRGDTPEKLEIKVAYAKQVPHIQALLLAMGIPQIRSAEAEADDIAGLICRELPDRWQIELNSRDEDWWQALAPNINWYSGLTKKLVTLEMLCDAANDLKDGHFVGTDEYLTCMALTGDTSDTIPGVMGVGMKTAAKNLRKFGSLEALWAAADAGEKLGGVITERIAEPESRALVARNRQLMDWRQAPALNTSELAAFWLSPDLAEFAAIADAFGLSSVLSKAKKMPDKREAWTPAWHAVVSAIGI